jgi:transposase
MKQKKAVTNNVTRQRYSAQFKQQAVERAAKEGVVAVSRDLAIASAQLYQWRAKLKQTGQSFEVQQQHQAEFNRLKRDNERLQQEVDFLKKAAAYFAKQSK